MQLIILVMVKNILAVRNDRFGEFLLIIPALKALKEEYPQARLSLAVSAEAKELASLIEGIEVVFVWDEIKNKLRKQKFDCCIIFNPTKEAHIKSFLAGIPIRVGYNRKWGFLLTHKIEDTKYLGTRHEVICNLELIDLITKKKLFSLESIPALDLRIPETDKYDFLKDAIAIHPFTSDIIKQWPKERFLELGQRIFSDLGEKVVFVGRSEESFSVDTRLIDLINKTTLVELAQVLKQCKLLISCDSGPVHLAASIGIPVVAIFRNDLPGKTAKRWGPWGEGHIVIEDSSLENISVEDVFSRIKEKLSSF